MPGKTDYQPGWFAVTWEYNIKWFLGHGNHASDCNCNADAVDSAQKPIKDPKTHKILKAHQSKRVSGKMCAFTRSCGSETERKNWKNNIIIPRLRVQIQKEIADRQCKNELDRQDKESGRPPKKKYSSYKDGRLEVKHVNVLSGSAKPKKLNDYKELSRA